MCFVQDSYLIRRQDAALASLATDEQVEEEQGMVDDQQLGLVDLAARLVIKAVLEILAFFAQAIARIAFHQLPDGDERAKTEVATAAVAGRARPLADGLKL